MEHVIITKRIEPYDLIEGIKKKFEVEDFTFIGMNKFEILEKFLAKMAEIQVNKVSFGLYMKNVNKFYLISCDKTLSELENVINKDILENILKINLHKASEKDIVLTQSRDKALSAVDMGKAEASLIIS